MPTGVVWDRAGPQGAIKYGLQGFLVERRTYPGFGPVYRWRLEAYLHPTSTAIRTRSRGKPCWPDGESSAIKNAAVYRDTAAGVHAVP